MSNRETGQYNLRQYDRIIHLIDEYNNGRIFIGKLINDLEALIDTLEDIPNDQRNLLLSHWGLLEEVYAVNLDKGVPELDQQSKELIKNSVG